MGTYNVERSRKNVYIFRNDRQALIDFALRQDSGRQATGDLFGLWTTNGEPVIHIVCPQHLCTERGSNFDDTIQKYRPLSHIGNWRCYDSEAHQMDPHQPGKTRCSHETKGTFLGLAIGIKSQTKLIMSPCLFRFQKQSSRAIHVEKCNMELLEAENPFKSIERIKEIALNSRLDDCLDGDQMDERKWPRVSKGSPSNTPKHQGHTSAPKALSRKQVDRADISAVKGAKQSHALCSTSNQRFQSGFASNGSFKVFMFKEDCQMMENLVLEYPHLETGGDLFGLWTSNGDAVLHM